MSYYKDRSELPVSSVGNISLTADWLIVKPIFMLRSETYSNILLSGTVVMIGMSPLFLFNI